MSIVWMQKYLIEVSASRRLHGQQGETTSFCGKYSSIFEAFRTSYFFWFYFSMDFNNWIWPY